jgi:Tol biopolymer transport system component
MTMNLRNVLLLCGIAGAIVAAESGNDLFQKGLAKERAEGDLRGAIQLYQRAASLPGVERKLAAEALFRIAECQQALGNSEARKVYQRIVKDFADQREVAARAGDRLSALDPVATRQATELSTRRVWTAPARRDIYGTVSPDGRLVPYTNWDEHGDLFVHDLATGADRRLTNTANDQEYAEGSGFSRDGKQLAYAWLNGKNRYELRIIGLQGTGIPEFRRLFDNEDVNYVSPDDWSPDGKWLAVQLHRKDRSTQIGLIAIQDGSLRVLKTVGWRGATRLFFSSDSRYLAFDLPVSDTAEQRDVFVLAIDGSGEIPAVIHPSQDVLLGWSPDGKRLLFASDRSGSTGLWSLAFADGRPQGAPELLKPEIGRHEFKGVTTSGALYSAIWNSGGGPEIEVASFDFTAGKFLSKPVAPIQTFVGANQSPDWSPDGKYLAYVSLRGTVGSRYFVLGIRSVETGHIRELTPSPAFVFFQGLLWAPDGRSLLVGGQDAKGRHGIFRVDAQTGQSTIIVPREGNDGPHFLASSPDGKKLYYRSHPPGSPETAVVERDLASGDERELFRNAFIGSVCLSPDGRYIAAGIRDESTKFAAAVLLLVSGGEPRELMRVNPSSLTGFTGQLVGVAGWTPDSRSVLLRKSSPGGGQSETWLVSVDGKQRKLDLDLGIGKRIPQIRLHPDGQQIAFEMSGPQKPTEIWVLENFLPTLKASK